MVAQLGFSSKIDLQIPDTPQVQGVGESESFRQLTLIYNALKKLQQVSDGLQASIDALKKQLDAATIRQRTYEEL